MEASFWIALYGAVMSSVAVGWNIYNSVSLFRGRLKLDISRRIVVPRGEVDPTLWISCKVTNIGKSSRHIEQPNLAYSSHRVIHSKELAPLAFLELQPSDKYPLELKPGEVHEIRFELFDFDNQCPATLPQDAKLLFSVLDTHGKNYNSSQLSTRVLVGELRGAKSFLHARNAKSAPPNDH